MAKTIFITGGASGIGAATVSKFLSEGWNVAYTDIQQPEDKRQTDKALFVCADSSDKAAMTAAAQQAEQVFGGIDALFCNSGIHQRNTILDISQEDLDKIIRTNIYGTTYTLQAVLPHIIHRGGRSAAYHSSRWRSGGAEQFGSVLCRQGAQFRLRVDQRCYRTDSPQPRH